MVRTMSVILLCGDTVGDLIHVVTLSTIRTCHDTKVNPKRDLKCGQDNVSDLSCGGTVNDPAM